MAAKTQTVVCGDRGIWLTLIKQVKLRENIDFVSLTSKVLTRCDERDQVLQLPFNLLLVART